MRILFGDFTLDRARRQLLRGRQELHVEPKALQLLDLLLRLRPAAVSKGDIRDQLWPDTFVSEANLTRLVTQLRRALADDPKSPRFLRTVHGFGYAFAGDAAEPAPEPGRDSRSLHRLIWEYRVIPLEPGDNLIGRDEDAAVRIEAPGISRRHAQIVVVEDRAMLEDLGSKNGTYLQERRLDRPARLEDGDLVRVGRQLLTYRCAPLMQPTATEPVP